MLCSQISNLLYTCNRNQYLVWFTFGVLSKSLLQLLSFIYEDFGLEIMNARGIWSGSRPKRGTPSAKNWAQSSVYLPLFRFSIWFPWGGVVDAKFWRGAVAMRISGKNLTKMATNGCFQYLLNLNDSRNVRNWV